MANTSSAKKQIRSQAKKYVYNLRVKRTFRETRKEVEEQISSKKLDNIQEALTSFYKAVDKAAKANAIHKNTASRYKSRLTIKVNKALAAK